MFPMYDWDVINAIVSVTELVNMVADEFDEIPKEIVDELNRLTGNSWDSDTYIEYCCEYYESPNSLAEVVYALFHEGEFPQNIEHTDELNSNLIKFICKD